MRRSGEAFGVLFKGLGESYPQNKGISRRGGHQYCGIFSLPITNCAELEFSEGNLGTLRLALPGIFPLQVPITVDKRWIY